MAVNTLTVAQLLAAFNSGTLAAGVSLRDSAAHIDANLDALQAVVQAGLLQDISFTNGGRAIFAVTPTQLDADAAAIALITSPFLIEQRITATEAAGVSLAPPFQYFAAVDSAANLAANLPALEALRNAGRLGIVRLTDTGPVTFDLSAAELVAGINTLSRIGSTYSIALTDPGTPTITLPTSDASTINYSNVIALITTPFALEYTGITRSPVIASIEIGNDYYSNSGFYGSIPANPVAPLGTASADLLPDNIQIWDYQGTIGRLLESLQIAAAAGKLTSIRLRDAGTNTLSLTPQQATDGALVLSKLSPNFLLSQVITADQAASPPPLDSRFFNYTVQDSFAKVMANMAAIDALARSGRMGKLRIAESAPDIALSAAQIGQAIYPLTFYYFETFRTITLTDPGTPTITIDADILSIASIQTQLNLIPNSYHLEVKGTISAGVASSIVAENNKVLASLTQLHVADFGSNVAFFLGALQTLAVADKLSQIDFVDTFVPALGLAPAAISADAAALAKISSPYVAGSAPSTTGFFVAASDVPGQLSNWEAMAEARTLGTISLSDGGTPTIFLSAATVAQDLAALAAIGSAYQIVLTDGGTPTLTLAPWQYKLSNLSVLAKIGSPFSVALPTTLTASAAAAIVIAPGGITEHLTGVVNIADFGSSVVGNISALETLFDAGHLGTIQLLGAGVPRVIATSQQASAGPDVLHAITSAFFLSQQVTAAAAATEPVPSGDFDSLTVVDTAANIAAQLSSLEALAVSGRLVGVGVNGPNSYTLSAATLAANAEVFLRMGSMSISLTDPGTPTLVLQDWQITSNINTLLTSITTPFQLVVEGPVRPSVAAIFANGGSTIIDKLAPNALTIREHPTNYSTFLPFGGPFTNYLPQLLTLVNAGKIASIDPRNNLAYWSLTPADATTYAPVLAKSNAPFVLVQQISVADLPTISTATLDPRFFTFGVFDSYSNIIAALPQIEPLAASGLIGRINFSDIAPPRVVTTAADVMAYADAWGAQDYAPYPTVLTDPGTPVISLPSYQLNYNMRNDLLDVITGPWQLNITDRATAGLMATIAIEHNGVLSHLGSPVAIADTAYNVQYYLDQLEYLTENGKVASISLIDGGLPTLSISAEQVTRDAAAIAKIDTPVNISNASLSAFDEVAGSGHLVVNNQATLLAGTGSTFAVNGLIVGGTAGTAGDVTVANVKSLLSNTGDFTIGGAGHGILTIRAGGTVTTADSGAEIAADAGSDGSGVNVVGTGSTWQIGGNLQIGDAAFGSLSIAAGGSVTAGSADLSVQPDSSSVVSVVGTGSALTLTGSLVVGDAASAELSILSGATVSAQDANIGVGATATGNVDIEGAGSHLKISNDLNIGLGGVGVLTLGNNTELTVVNFLNIGTSGVLNSFGGIIDPAVVNNTGRAGGKGQISASVSIVNSGTLFAASGTETLIAPIITGKGVLEIDAGGNLVVNAGSVVDTQTVTFTDATGTLTIGTLNGFTATIGTFNDGDLIAVPGTTIATTHFDSGTHVLTLFDGSDNVAGTLKFGPTITNGSSLVVNGVPPCFVAGTRIGTERGEISVEELRVGDVVQVVWPPPPHSLSPSEEESRAWMEGRAARIIWLGHRTIACLRHPDPRKVWPIRVAAEALGPGRPARDLWLSPDHALFIDNVLIPVKHLVNDGTIAQVPVDEVTYYHVELTRHAILLAEGLPAESYLDTGDRGNFTNGGGAVVLHPEFASRSWDAAACAPLVVSGPPLAAARRWVNAYCAASRISTVLACGPASPSFGSTTYRTRSPILRVSKPPPTTALR